MDPSTWGTYLVTQESHSPGRDTVSVVEEALEHGIDAVQLREKGMDARRRYRLGIRLRDLTDEAGVPLIVNDRIDLARAIAADGVHLGQSDLPVEIARDQLDSDAVVGCSAATVEEARTAETAGADYLGVGAVYGTDSKDVDGGKNGVGPERIRAIAEAVELPIVGIGGIDAGNAAAVVEAGAVGVAVISAITTADDPAAATRELREVVTDVR